MKIGFHGENSELDNKKMGFGFRSHENLKKLWMSLILRPQEIGCYLSKIGSSPIEIEMLLVKIGGVNTMEDGGGYLAYLSLGPLPWIVGICLMNGDLIWVEWESTM